MRIGMVGLGRMGANLVRRLLAAGHDCVVFDTDPDAVAAMADEGAVGADSLADLAGTLDAPRAVWVMVPAAITAQVINDVAEHLDRDDVVIDGGNSFYRDDIDRAEQLRESGIHHLDVGTSGGVFGLERGFCLMIGGDGEVVSRLDPIFASIAPGVDAAPRSPGRTGEPSRSEQGYLHCGSHGAGHFVKMVHNGIEYGIMASYAGGDEHPGACRPGCRSAAGRGCRDRAAARPEVLPVRPRHRRDRAGVAPRERGRLWLLDLTAVALAENPILDDFGGQVSDSGEGRWTVQAAVELGVPASVLSTALFDRFSSRDDADFGDRLLSALRKQFGGHEEKAPSIADTA